MSEFRCKRIAGVLSAAMASFGWDGFVFSFTVGTDWTEPGADYVREASGSMVRFLRDYRAQSIHRSHHRLSVVRTDLPQTFEVAAISGAPADRRLARLMTDHGWRSGMVFPQYGYGAALGLTTFVARTPHVDPAGAAASIAYLAPWQMQLNAWARALVDTDRAGRKLSTREVECLLQVADGRTSRQIADAAGIATRTVEFHIQNAMHKLGSSSRSHAASRLIAARG